MFSVTLTLPPFPHGTPFGGVTVGTGPVWARRETGARPRLVPAQQAPVLLARHAYGCGPTGIKRLGFTAPNSIRTYVRNTMKNYSLLPWSEGK